MLPIVLCNCLLFNIVANGFIWPDVYGHQLQVQYGSQRVTPGMSLDITGMAKPVDP